MYIGKQLEKYAVEVLKGIRIEKGQTILDCCCGAGTYTLPAARLVGKEGLVYAVDVSNGELNDLKQGVSLGIYPKEIDLVVLSHIHGDHVGGLPSFLGKNPEVVVYLPKSFPKGFKDGVKEYGAKIIEVQEPLKICQEVYSTGELGTGIKEQSLIIDTEKGLIGITGCAHPGIVKIVNKAKDLVKGDVLFVMGGFHLGGESKGEIENIISSFRKLGVSYVGPCHCSGDAARQLFKKEYAENFINVGVGRVVTMNDLR